MVGMERTSIYSKLPLQCDWKVDGACLACSSNYGRVCINALAISKKDISDLMAITGTFASILLTKRVLEFSN